MNPARGAGLIALCIFGALCVPLRYAAAQEVSFADSNLEAAVREAIGKPTGTIFASDLQGLTELQATARGITDLAGIQHCTDLQRLWLGGNQIVGLQPLSNLAALQHLYLWDNRISDLEPLSSLASLAILDLAGNLISSVAPLSALTSLMELGLEHNQLSDLQPLAPLTNLRMLGLSFNAISDLQPLAGLSNLQYLSLWSNQVAGLHALAGLSNLQLLDASANGISDLQPLAGLAALRYLYLADNAIADLAPLTGLHSLQQLDVARNLVADLGPLVANPGLGPGDVVILNENWLVLGQGTQASLDVQSLRSRGVNVWCDNQRAPQPPEAPVGLTATINAFGHVALTWTDRSDDEGGFHIQRRRQNPDGSWPQQWTAIATVPANRETYTDDTLTAAGTCQYRVQAYNAVGSSDWATSQSVSVNPPVPAAPSRVAVWPVNDDTALRVNWQDNSSNETSFKVERRQWLPTERWSDWETRLWTSPNFTAFTDDQMTVGSSYQYRVRAVNHMGHSDWATSVGVRCKPTPLWPVDVTAHQPHPAEGVQLTWRDKSTRELGFEVQRRKRNPDGSWPQWTTVGWPEADAESWADLTVAEQGTHEYRIRAYNANGESEWSKSVSLWAVPRAPRAPSNLTVQAVNDSSAIRVAWQDNSDNETSFKVERRRWLPAERWSDWETRLWTSPNFTVFTDDQIPFGSSYQYRVRAVNLHGHSDWATSTGVRCEPTPLWPVDVTAHQPHPAEGVQMTWRDKSTRELGFEIQRRKRNPDGTWPQWTTVGWPVADAESWTDLTIAEQGTHEYRIRAYNANGASEWSQSVTLWAVPRAPRAPGNLTAQATAGSTAIYVTWQDNSDNETSFKVERRRWLPTERWSEWETRLWTSPNFTSFVDYEIPLGSSYQYRVRAVNSHGHSDWATSIGVRCEPTPLWPVDLHAQPHSSGADVLLTWQSRSDKETYLKVQRRRQLSAPDEWSDWLTIVWLGGGVTQYLDNDVPGDGRYQYRVCVFNERGPSEYSLPATIWREVINPAALSVTAMSAQQVGQTASVIYGLSSAAKVTLEIRNIAGRLIATVHQGRASAGLNAAQWNLRNRSGAPVPSGVYFCTLIARSDDGTEARLTGSVRVQR